MSNRSIDPLVDATISKGIEPILKRLHKDLGQPLSTEIVIIMDGIPGPRVLVFEGGHDERLPDGEARVQIRRAFKGDRYIYSVDAVYRRDFSPKTGFSGFTAKGDIRICSDGILDVRTKNWTVRYNVWEFSER